MMDRITLHEVQQAYKETGAIPRRGNMFKKLLNIYCCGLGVIAYKGIGEQIEEMGKGYTFLLTRFSGEYIGGFARGFDNTYYHDKLEDHLQEYQDGFKDGFMIAQAVFPNEKNNME